MGWELFLSLKEVFLVRKDTNDIVCRSTYEALTLLVNGCYFSQDRAKEMLRLPGKSFDKEFCTVKMSTARRSGHSTALAKIALEHFDKALFLAPTLSMVNHLQEIVHREYTRRNYPVVQPKTKTKNSLIRLRLITDIIILALSIL